MKKIITILPYPFSIVVTQYPTKEEGLIKRLFILPIKQLSTQQMFQHDLLLVSIFFFIVTSSYSSSAEKLFRGSVPYVCWEFTLVGKIDAGVESRVQHHMVYTCASYELAFISKSLHHLAPTCIETYQLQHITYISLSTNLNR